MRPDHEELILRNPVLGACAYWQLARAFSTHSDGDAPLLPHFLIAAGLLFHRSTVDKIKAMQFDSGLLKAVSERPDIVAGLQFRVESYSSAALSSLQVGTATAILKRETASTLPAFRAVGPDMPKAVRNAEGHVNDIYKAARRVGAWFATDSLDAIQRRLIVTF